MAMLRIFSVLALLAISLHGSSAIICNECRTAGTAGAIDYCADPNADTLVACPQTQNLCYTTLALISNRIVISRGCGRPLSLPAAANLAPNTCRAFGDLSATAIFCICDGQACNNQTAASPDVQQGLQQVAAIQPNNNNNVQNDDDRQSRTLVPGQVSSSATIVTGPAAGNSVQVLVPSNQNNARAVYIVQQTNPTTTTTTTTETPVTEAATAAPASSGQQIQVLVPNANTRPVYIVRPNGQGGQETVQIIYPSSTTQSSVAVNIAQATNAPVAAIRNPLIIQQLVPGAATPTSTVAPATVDDHVPAASDNNNTVVIINTGGNAAASSTESNMADMVRMRGSTTMSSAGNVSESGTTIIAVIEKNGTVSTPNANSANRQMVGSSAVFMAVILAIVHKVFV